MDIGLVPLLISGIPKGGVNVNNCADKGIGLVLLVTVAVALGVAAVVAVALIIEEAGIDKRLSRSRKTWCACRL